MHPYYACAVCACYVKKGDFSCPFCGAMNRAPAVETSGRSVRVSRARWLAYGSALAALGCTSNGASGPAQAEDAAARDEAGAELEASHPYDGAAGVDSSVVDSEVERDAPIPDGALDVTRPDAGLPSDAAIPDAPPADAAGGDGGFRSAEGGFSCFWDNQQDAAALCDRAAQWCFISESANYGPSACRPLDTNCTADVDAGTACHTMFQWDAAACGGGYRRCACLTMTVCGGGGGGCSDDGLGGLTVSSCTCYGAPPSRLERLAA
jgi:hypothetical protein